MALFKFRHIILLPCLYGVDFPFVMLVVLNVFPTTTTATRASASTTHFSHLHCGLLTVFKVVTLPPMSNPDVT